jgi:hypothetical protein
MHALLTWTGCLILLPLLATGCALCANPYDASYAAYGGLRQRTDMVHGRVGSVFDPASEVSRVTAAGQSPHPGAAEGSSAQPTPAGPETAITPESDTAAAPPEASPSPQGPDSKLPQAPEGTMELPELEPDDSLEPETLPSPSQLPPDLPGQNDRSAWRHPLRDVLEEELPLADGSSR